MFSKSRKTKDLRQLLHAVQVGDEPHVAELLEGKRDAMDVNAPREVWLSAITDCQQPAAPPLTCLHLNVDD